jgi:ribose/xylose/arabinose/galactoside ABC-type transport system permease subunit
MSSMNKKEHTKVRIAKYRLSSSQSLIMPPLVGLIVLTALVSVLSPYFLTVNNVLNVLRQVSIIGIVSVGMSYVIFTGGIDLSVGSVAALSGVVTGLFIKELGWNLSLSIFLGILAGAACGIVNGVFVTSRIKMPPFISTLAMMSIARGVALVITSGRPIFNLPDSFSVIGGSSVFGIPVPIIIMVVIYLLAHFNLCHGRIGLYFYVVGGDEEAGRVSGINTGRVKMLAYVISGICAAVAGIVLSSRVMVSEPIAGYGYELDAIASVIIGGANLFGGEGLIAGTFIGAIIIGILRNGLNLLNVSTYLQQVVIGVVIAGMVSISILRRK